MSGYLDWFDQYCNFCKKITPHGRDDNCREDEPAIVWCLVCKKTFLDDEENSNIDENKDPKR